MKKIVEDKLKTTSNKKETVSNPISKQSNSAKKPTLNTPKKKISSEKASNPIVAETSAIVARINNFNTNKTSNRMYAGYMNNSSAYKVVDYSDIVYSTNSALTGKNGVQELFTAVHDLFTEKLKSVFTAFGIYHEKSKCINVRLFNSMGSTYTSKIFLSDEENPVIKCFNTTEPVFCSDNKFLNIPYMHDSASLVLPLNSVNGCKGVMVIGKDHLENHTAVFSFIANYCALFIQNIELLEQTNKYTNTDTLTGLYTHRGFQEILTSELKRAQDNDSQLSIIMLDINNISKINRELGHAKGDEVIKTVAEKIKQNIRANDSAGRYGGDEIAVIMPDTDTKDAKY